MRAGPSRSDSSDSDDASPSLIGGVRGTGGATNFTGETVFFDATVFAGTTVFFDATVFTGATGFGGTTGSSSSSVSFSSSSSSLEFSSSSLDFSSSSLDFSSRTSAARAAASPKAAISTSARLSLLGGGAGVASSGSFSQASMLRLGTLRVSTSSTRVAVETPINTTSSSSVYDFVI